MSYERSLTEEEAFGAYKKHRLSKTFIQVSMLLFDWPVDALQRYERRFNKEQDYSNWVG